MKTKQTILEELEKITDEYGQLHESNCDLNAEGGSFDGCDCAMKSLVKEISDFFSKALNEQKVEILKIIKKIEKDLDGKMMDKEAIDIIHTLKKKIKKL